VEDGPADLRVGATRLRLSEGAWREMETSLDLAYSLIRSLSSLSKFSGKNLGTIKSGTM